MPFRLTDMVNLLSYFSYSEWGKQSIFMTVQWIVISDDFSTHTVQRLWVFCQIWLKTAPWWSKSNKVYKFGFWLATHPPVDIVSEVMTHPQFSLRRLCLFWGIIRRHLFCLINCIISFKINIFYVSCNTKLITMLNKHAGGNYCYKWISVLYQIKSVPEGKMYEK